jgi:UDP-3-O-[3-hydroxymyristoyl] N-acetylglucosamine deacetylase
MAPTQLQTLRREVSLGGTGLHSGAAVTVRLRPRREAGILLVRTDLPGAPVIHAAPDKVVQTVHATTLQDGNATVATTEHLLAALWALGVTNCRVELSGPEVPILDGSAEPWCRLIAAAGIEAVAGRRPFYKLREPVWIEEGNSSLLGLPHLELRVTVAVEYEHLPRQVADVTIEPATFGVDLAPARTFTLEEWIAPLQAQGLIRGGSEENAIVLRRGEPSTPFRFANELARHKALDILGDIALLFAPDGGWLHAHLIATRAGHSLHRRWMDECRRRGALVACESGPPSLA